jgi:hypothetical protein
MTVSSVGKGGGLEHKSEQKAISTTKNYIHLGVEYVMIDLGKGDGRARPPPPSGWANFPIIIKCTPDSGDCHSVSTTTIQ